MTEPVSIQGQYFARGSSKSHEARLCVSNDQLLLTNAQGEALSRYSLGDFRISDPLGNLPYRFDFNDGAVFETRQHQDVENLFRHNARHFRWWIHGLEKSRRWILLALILLPLLAWVFLQYGLPIVAKPLAKQIPPVVLKQFDRRAMESLDEGGWIKPSRASREDRQKLQNAWISLARSGALRAEDFDLLQRDGGVFGANAFALPGGTIVVTDRLLEALETEREVVAVLAHEAGHVALRHGTRKIIQALGVAALFATIVGDVSWLAESILVSAPTLLQQMSYSRNFEREADQFAIDQLQALNIPASCLGVSLANIVRAHRQTQEKDEEKASQADQQDRPRWFDYLSTHPAIEERIESARGNRC